MKLGDTVQLASNPYITGVIKQMPTNSAKRKRPRALVADPAGGEQWFYLDELVEVPDDKEV